MKNKVLKLCKRLSKVTASEIAPILMLDEKEVSNILNELVSEDKLTVREDLIYFYKEVESQKSNPIFLEYHPKEESEFILKCYCIGVKTEQCAFLLGIGDATSQKYNMYFRKIIYQNQLAELKKYFNKKPKLPKMRTFYDTEVYFYMYDNKLFVVDKPLKSNIDYQHTRDEKLRIKVLYSRLRRSINHSNKKKFMHHHVAEGILRMHLSDVELIDYLKKYINF